MIEEDAVVLSGHIWRFLRTCLQGGASQILESCGEDLNGLEVWRRLIYRIEQGREQRVEDLRELIDKPPRIPNLIAVPAAIDAFDKVLKEYTSATGKKYFFNTETRVTQWDMPEEMKAAEEAAKAAAAAAASWEATEAAARWEEENAAAAWLERLKTEEDEK